MVNFKFNDYKYSFSRIGFIKLKKSKLDRNFIYNKRISFNSIFPKIKLNQCINIINILSPDEPKHSKIIGNLINPIEKHGYGYLFLELFFKYVLNDPDFHVSKDDKWIVTIEKEGRFDIRIRNQNNTKIIIVENKSNNAEDRPNQLYRYWFYGIYQPQSIISNINPVYKKLLYLSPSFSKKYDKQSITRPKELENTLPEHVQENLIKIIYFHKEIDSWLSICMENVDKYSEIYYCLKQYKDFWRYNNG